MTPAKQFTNFLLTGFGSGYAPKAAGTAGSAAAFVLAGSVYVLDSPRFLFWMLLLTGISFLICILGFPYVRASWSDSDPSEIVMDEFAGLFLAFSIVGDLGLVTGMGIFFLFRVFDMWKPVPIDQVQRLHGGWGLVLDDLIAGGFAGVCTLCYLFLLVPFL